MEDLEDLRKSRGRMSCSNRRFDEGYIVVVALLAVSPECRRSGTGFLRTLPWIDRGEDR